MLDFLLVLGLIPGTNFQVTFNELITLILLALIWLFRAPLCRFIIKRKQIVINYLEQKAWRRRQLSLPV